MKSELFQSARGKRVVGSRTICEIHREVYDAIVLDELDRAVVLLEEAFETGRRMAKRMMEQKIYDIDQIAAKGGADEETRRLRRKERAKLHEMLEELNG